MKFPALLVLVMAAAAGCTAVVTPAPQPQWVQAKIADFERLPVANPPREILRTTFSGRTVYLVTPTCCDIPGELYDDSGRLLCYPFGGFAGGDGRCPGFSLAPDASRVWRDGRAPSARMRIPEGK